MSKDLNQKLTKEAEAALNSQLAPPPPAPHGMKLLAVVAILAALTGLFMLVGPAGRIPLLDANRVMLAETPAEATCAAEAHFGRQGQESYDECVATSNRGSERDLQEVPTAFCEGVKRMGWPGTITECLDIMSASQLWPTKELTPYGWISNSWNRKFPYPGSLIGIGNQNTDNSRTGDREDSNLRDGEITR